MTEEERKRVEELLEEGEDEETEIVVGGVSGCGLVNGCGLYVHNYIITQSRTYSLGLLLLLGYKCL